MLPFYRYPLIPPTPTTVHLTKDYATTYKHHPVCPAHFAFCPFAIQLAIHPQLDRPGQVSHGIPTSHLTWWRQKRIYPWTVLATHHGRYSCPRSDGGALSACSPSHWLQIQQQLDTNAHDTPQYQQLAVSPPSVSPTQHRPSSTPASPPCLEPGLARTPQVSVVARRFRRPQAEPPASVELLTGAPTERKKGGERKIVEQDEQ